MASQDGSGGSLLDLMTSDVPPPSGSFSSGLPSPGGKGVDRKGRKLGLSAVPESSVSPAKVVSPVATGFGPLKQKKKV